MAAETAPLRSSRATASLTVRRQEFFRERAVTTQQRVSHSPFRKSVDSGVRVRSAVSPLLLLLAGR